MENVVNLIMNNGMAVVIVGYFLYKDHKFNAQIIDLMGQIKGVLSELRGGKAGKDE